MSISITKVDTIELVKPRKPLKSVSGPGKW